MDSVKSIIVDYLRGVFLKDKKKWVQRKEIERLPALKMYSGHTVTRRCQELAEIDPKTEKKGVIDVLRMPKGKGKTKLAWYRYIDPKESIVWKGRKSQDSKKIKLTH